MKSGDIDPDPDVEVLDPNVHLATVSEGGKLNIELRLKKGRGYVSAERNFDDDLQVDYIPVDSVHSPVKKMNFHVEAARLGQDTDYDKLTMEVWTNGSVSPEHAIGLAAKLIKDHMSIFINFEEEAEEPVEIPIAPTISPINEHLDKSVDECYEKTKFTSDAKRVGYLFELYDGLVKGEKMKTKK